MSQNKTVIQGLEPETPFNGSSSTNPSQNFYSRGSRPITRGTVVPGMQEAMPEAPTSTTIGNTPQAHRTIQSGKPVVGFLYSVSRSPMGEFWPIQMGKNTIGQSSENDIILAEGTVSSKHAVIVTRPGKNGVIAAIKDSESTNGTKINGEPIDFAAEECHDGDIITIGNNYQFLFILIDAAKMGLAPVKEFIPIEVAEEHDEEDEIPPFVPGGATRPGGFDPFNGGSSWGGGTASNGTVGMDGSTSGNNHGGTIPM